MPDFPIIDSHVHLADPGRISYPWMAEAPSLNRLVLPADLKRAAAPVVVEGLVFVEVDAAAGAEVAEAEWVDDLGARQPSGEPKIRGAVASLPLERGADAVRADLERLSRLRSFRGVRRLIQGQADPEYCTRPDFISAVQLLGRRDVPFDICIYERQLPAAIRLVEACPDVRFVLDHIAKPRIRDGLMEPWRTKLRELARCENVWCKISGVATEADHSNWTEEQLRPYIAHAIDVFGFGRVMFGGDWHVAELAIRYPRWVEIVDRAVEGASVNEKRALYRDNVSSFYRL